MDEDLIGKTIKNRYRVDKFLGRGGMAEVYKVFDIHRSVYLAMKVLYPDLAEDPAFVRRFKREARNLAKLQHPNIVRFYEMEQDDLLVFLTMDYIEGTTLRSEIMRAKGAPLSNERILEVMNAVCGALYYAHRSGMVHCDVKPANIMIEKTGRILLADFGIARQAEGSTTTTMATAGTPAYMAPEQVRGEDPTPQTDIYALGVVLYEMLNGGERPFTGEHATITGTTGEKVRWEQVNLKPQLPRRFNPKINEDLEAVVLKCLQKDSHQRYRTVLEVCQSLQNAIGQTIFAEEPGEPLPIQEESTAIQPDMKGNNSPLDGRSPKNRNSRILFIAISFVGIALIGMSILFMRARKSNSVVSMATPTPMITLTVMPTSTLRTTLTARPSSTPLPTYTKIPSPTPTKECLIAFLSKHDGEYFNEIYLMNDDGTYRRKLVDNYEYIDPPSWSPDGKKIAYIGKEKEKVEQIYTIDIDGSNRHQFTTFSNGEIGGYAPVWSHSGKYLAFSYKQLGNLDIYIVDTINLELKRLTNAKEDDYNPTWSKDDNTITYGSGREGYSGYYVMDINGSYIRSLTKNDANYYSLSRSPDGAKIAMESYLGDLSKLIITDSNGLNRRVLLELQSGFIFNIEWSPDSKNMVFISRKDKTYALNRIDLFGGSYSDLISGPEYKYSPQWSPGGSKILYNLWKGESGETHIMGSEGENPKKISDNFESYGASWSPLCGE